MVLVLLFLLNCLPKQQVDIFKKQFNLRHSVSAEIPICFFLRLLTFSKMIIAIGGKDILRNAGNLSQFVRKVEYYNDLFDTNGCIYVIPKSIDAMPIFQSNCKYNIENLVQQIHYEHGQYYVIDDPEDKNVQLVKIKNVNENRSLLNWRQLLANSEILPFHHAQDTYEITHKKGKNIFGLSLSSMSLCIFRLITPEKWETIKFILYQIFCNWQRTAIFFRYKFHKSAYFDFCPLAINKNPFSSKYSFSPSINLTILFSSSYAIKIVAEKNRVSISFCLSYFKTPIEQP
jgi:hypothetical protein